MTLAKFVNQRAKAVFKDLVNQYTEEDLQEHLDTGFLSELYILGKDELHSLQESGLKLPERGKHYHEWLKRYREEDYDARTLYGKRADKMKVWAYYIDGLVWEKVDKMIQDYFKSKALA